MSFEESCSVVLGQVTVAQKVPPLFGTRPEKYSRKVVAGQGRCGAFDNSSTHHLRRIWNEKRPPTPEAHEGLALRRAGGISDWLGFASRGRMGRRAAAPQPQCATAILAVPLHGRDARGTPPAERCSALHTAGKFLSKKDLRYGKAEGEPRSGRERVRVPSGQSPSPRAPLFNLVETRACS